MNNRGKRKHLTVTDGIRTISFEGTEEVDASVKKLLHELRKAEGEKWRAQRRIHSIHTALSILGVKPEACGSMLDEDRYEVEYSAKEPFKGLTLAETCTRILRDYAGKWLTRAQVEYLATRGGYDFSTKDPSNSVDVTLRRMASAGKCEADRVRGSRGSKYRYVASKATESETKQLRVVEG
jgi:hypothetical protein